MYTKVKNKLKQNKGFAETKDIFSGASQNQICSHNSLTQ